MAATKNQTPALLTHLRNRLEEFKQSDAEREKLFFELVRAYGELDTRYQEVLDDLHNEQSSRRQWQARSKELENSLATANKAHDELPFVMVLIDGDGAPFLEDFYQRGAEGGSDAASKLREELRTHIADLYPHLTTSHWGILVNIFVNAEGLSGKLRACGLLPLSRDLALVAQGFSGGQPLFQFIDVGPGKERADHKIREWFRLSLGNTQCKHIILGGVSHDNGYLPMLEPYKHDAATAQRVSLLATIPVQPAFMNLSFKPIRVDSVFRSDNLASGPTRPSVEKRMSLPHRALAREPTIDSPEPSSDSISLGSTSAPRTDSPVASLDGDATWAHVSRAKGGQTKEFNIASRKTGPKKYILLNRDQERLDKPLPSASKQSQDKLYQRVQKFGKVCNYYHLAGNCNGDCGFVHGEQLTDGELNALRFRARTRACTHGSSCRDFDCTFGHVCPFGSACHGKCYFETMHDADLIPFYKWYEDDQIERLTK